MGPDDFVYRGESPKPKKEASSLQSLHTEAAYSAKAGETHRLLTALIGISERPLTAEDLKVEIVKVMSDLDKANQADRTAPGYHSDDEDEHYDMRLADRLRLMEELLQVAGKTELSDMRGELLALKLKYDQQADTFVKENNLPEAGEQA